MIVDDEKVVALADKLRERREQLMSRGRFRGTREEALDLLRTDLTLPDISVVVKRGTQATPTTS